MTEWREATLREVLDIRHGFAFKGEYFRDEGDLIVLTPGNFIDTGGFKSKSGKEKYYDGPFPPSFLLSKGDVVIAMTEQAHGLLGSTATIPEDARYLHNQRLGLLRLTDPDHLDLRFCCHLLNTPTVREQIQATATGSKVRHTAPDRIRSVCVQLPHIATQRRIAAILDLLDNLIENNERRIELLDQMTKAIYREWFVLFRYPGHEDASFTDSPLGPIPVGWEVRPLGEISANYDRRRKPLSKAQRQERAGSLPYYGAAKLIDWVDGWIFDGEYLLFAEDGSVQTSTGLPVLQLVDGKFWANNHTHILRGNGVSTRFLYLASAVHPVTGYVTGAAQPKITQANLNRIPVLVAQPSLQESFDQVVDPIFDEWRALQTDIAPLAAIRDLLLPKLVTGQIDVSDLDLDAVVESVS